MARYSGMDAWDDQVDVIDRNDFFGDGDLPVGKRSYPGNHTLGTSNVGVKE